jgi:SAM-dependent methyltransferase
VTAWRQNFQIDVSPEYHGVSEIQMWECSTCSISFFMPESLAGSARLYSELEKFDWYYMPQKWEYGRALKDLRECKRVLEVGCGSGNFLKLAREEAGLQVEGLEKNTRAIQEALQQGFHVTESTVEDFAKERTSNYDAVCCFQVLEHVPRQKEFLNACCDLLRPGGRLLLGVPNADSFIRYEFNVLDMPPHHMSRWPRKAMLRLPDYFPVRVTHVLQEPLAEYHVQLYVNAYCAHFARGPFRLFNSPRLRTWLAHFLRLGPRQALRGQTVYACYERI